jgi:hypothetical protein
VNDHLFPENDPVSPTAGKRWAALTNGRVWRVYDDHIPGLPNVKLIAEARLDEPDFAEFLEAIGRGSVTASGMDCVRAWARARREKEDERKKEEGDRTTRAKVLAEMLRLRLKAGSCRDFSYFSGFPRRLV